VPSGAHGAGTPEVAEERDLGHVVDELEVLVH